MTDIAALGLKVTSNGIVKTTSELDKFALSAKKAGQAASKPINVKASGPSAKVLGELRAMEKALASVRAASRAGIAVRITSAGNAKAISDISKLAATLTSARASARSPISVRVASAGNAKAISDIARMGTALRDARAAARSPINVRVTANGVGAAVTEINRFTTAINRARAASNSPVRSQVGNSGGGIGGSAPTAGDIGATKGMTGAVLGLVAAYVSLQSIISGGKLYASLVDESKMLTAQLKLATSETGSFVQAQKDVRAIAAETRGDLGATATLYGKLMLNSRELGITQVEAARATETVTKAFKISGSNAVETAQGTRQLVQALQSGVLRGDEFNTMAESAPRLQKLLADSLGVTTGALREMAANGELTSEKLTRAFTDKKFTESLDKEFAQLPVTFDDAMGQIYNAAVLTFGAFDEGGEFSKAITSFLVDGANGFADMEASARAMGASVRGEIDGLVAALGPAISSMAELISLFDQGKQTSDQGIFSTLFKELDAITGWYADNKWWIAPFSMTPGSRTNLSAPYEQGRRQASNSSLEREVMGKANAAVGWNSAADVLREEKALTRVTAATGKATKAKKEHASAAENLAKRLENERKATEALIEGLYESAAGYYESAAAGKKAQVEAEAVAKGMKKGGDAAAYTAQQLRKYVAEQVSGSAESVRAMIDQTDAQKQINDRVEAGTLSAMDAERALSDLNEQRSLMIALDIAKTLKDEGVAATAAQSALDALRAAQKKSNDETQRKIDLAQENQILIGVGDINKETEELRKLGEARINAMKGLGGDALEDELRRLAQAYELTALAAEYDRKVAEANAAGHYKAAAAYTAEYEARKKQIEMGQYQGNTKQDMERNRNYAIAAAHDIADIIGGGIGNAANALIDAVAEIGGAVSEMLGQISASFSKGAKLGGAFGAMTGSRTGGAIGGGLGQIGGDIIGKALTAAGSKLGAFVGPLGAIAGGLIGGLIGGLLKKTPKASATISIIAGEAMDTAISGNKSKLKAAAGQMANSVISGLTDLAAALGAELTGDAKVSIGMRGKNYRVDPTGAGRTKGAGVIDFGEDQAAAIAYALQDAIKDGVLSGLGESLNNLIKGDGDLQAQLEKALSFKGVFDELAQLSDPQAFDLAGLDKWRAGMDKIFAEAGATADEIAKLEELTGLKRVEIIEKYAKEAEAKAREYRELEIQIMELEGKSVEALAATRALELAAVDESQRPLYQRIYQLQDEATAMEKAVAIADERASLELQLLTLQGDTVALRAKERAEIDPLNQDIYDLINAMTDWQIAVQTSKDLFAAQSSVEVDILRLQAGLTKDVAKSELALKIEREAQLRAADPALRSLLQTKFALEDLTTAADAAAEAAQKAADTQKAISDEVKDLDRQWLELIGDTAKLRQMDLAALLSDDARTLQQKIWAYQDAKDAEAAATDAAAKAAEAAAAAQEEYANRLASARDVLSQAYERESSALQSTIEKFKGFADTIAEFRRGLFASDNPATAFAQTRATFQNTSRLASLGSEKAFGNFTGDAQAYLDAAKNQVGSQLEYQAIVAEVMKASLLAESGANGMASEAQRQLDLMTQQTEGILELNEKFVTFADALTAYTDVQSQEIPVFVDTVATGLTEVVGAVMDTATTSNEKVDNLIRVFEQVLDRMNRLDRNINNVTRGGNYITVGSDADAPNVRTEEVTP